MRSEAVANCKWVLISGVVLFGTVGMGAQAKKVEAKAACRLAVVEGEVKAGQGFEREFAPGLRLLLEPLLQGSGWIVRILPMRQTRGAHDFAELATPPYRSVTPLAVSTDFAFRAQDAVGWNPRRFRYAENAAVAVQLEALYGGVVSNDATASTQLAALVTDRPEGELQILNAVIVPGTANQWQMAAAVAVHFENTPHTVEQGAQSSLLGKLESMQFRVKLQLAPGMQAAKDVTEENIPCAVRPMVTSKQPH